MYGGVWSDQRVHRGSQSHHKCQSVRWPSCVVLEHTPNFRTGRLRREHPERNQNSKEPANMQNEHEGLDHGQLSSEESVEYASDRCHSNGKESGVPVLRNVVGIVENNESLDLKASSKALSGDSCLPA